MAVPASVLNTNIGSTIARRNLAGAQTKLAESVERLSSGLRINRAKDDAAGMAVGSVIDGQTRVAATALRNVNDAVSMIQTAEGALQEATGVLTRIKELAVQGANDSLSRDQYYFLVQEMGQLIEELVNTAARTTFNGNKLLGSKPTGITPPIIAHPVGVWGNLNTAGVLDSLSGRVRVQITVSAGSLKLDGTPANVSISTPSGPPGSDGSTESLVLEGNLSDVQGALSLVRAKRTESGKASIKFDVYEFSNFTLEDGVVTNARTGTNTSGAQQNVFLGGRFIELGIAQNGGFGSVGESIPAGFFGRKTGSGIGMVSDIDGFGVGADSRIDYFLPGSPEERWSISFKDGATDRFGGFSARNSSSTSPDVSLVSSSISILSSAGSETLEAGYNGEVAVGGNSKIKLEVVHRLNEDARFFETVVKVINVSGGELSNVKFMRSFDPDNTVDVGGSFVTTNTIESQASSGGRSLVSAKSNFAAYKAAYGEDAYIAYLSDDSRSHVYTGGFTNANPDASIVSADSVGSQVTADEAIGIVFSLGQLRPGDIQQFKYKTILSASEAAKLSTPVLKKTINFELSVEEPQAATSQTRSFISGPGSSDAIHIQEIPIWDTAEAAATRDNGAGYAGGAVKVGALSALYQRILWLSDPANSPLTTGQGYYIFSENVQGYIGVPDQQVFARDGSLVSALGMSLNELVDDSILQINAHRSYFGRYVGRMEHNIANLAALSENLTATGSRIRDTDYGAETAALTRTQILQQAATAMLAQANAMPNVVLELLRQ